MNENNECSGCLALYFSNSTECFECVYTRLGIENIPNCPCKKCLIKGICTNNCETFSEISKDDSATYDIYIKERSRFYSKVMVSAE